MSFNNLKLAELRAVAEGFGVEVPPKTSKANLIALLLEEGVSYQDYERFSAVEKEEPEPQPGRPKTLDFNDEQTILVKMERANFSYQVEGITFTKEHPFVALPSSIAERIFIQHAGFRPAYPNEVREFYS